ncbi:MAG TPA: BON domain-containing protein [Burkholderiaceae bacterium]|nr:BON domain-containing protein [Burkholderiaceae bacterium]
MKTNPCLLLRASAAAQSIDPPVQSSRPVKSGPLTAPPRSEGDFEASALWAMQDGYAIQPDRVQVRWVDGCVHLSGEVQWQYQKDGATRCVQALDGVKAVHNMLRLRPHEVSVGSVQRLAVLAVKAQSPQMGAFKG